MHKNPSLLELNLTEVRRFLFYETYFDVSVEAKTLTPLVQYMKNHLAIFSNISKIIIPLKCSEISSGKLHFCLTV